uniref:Proteasome inhibitor PI31 subunit n=1 Tax=Amblyomma triste TaxID=251400 RepID=A0A023GI52_AMBTT
MSRTGEVGSLSAYEKYFAFELLFKSCNESFQSKHDALVVIAHYLLVRSGKRCAGSGEVWADPQRSTTELLPVGWNENQDLYTIRYISAQNNEQYLLTAVRADNSLLICLLNVQKERTASTNLNVDKYVSEEYKDCSRAFKDLNAVINKLNREMISVMERCDSGSEITGVCDASPTASQESLLHMPSTRTGIERPQNPQHDLLGQRDLNPSFGLGGGMIMDRRHLPRPPGFDPRAIAPGLPRPQDPQHGPLDQRDLNPFFGCGLGGGMIIDRRRLPRSPGFDPRAIAPGLPRGAVPPGARVDPFGPAHPGHPTGFF